MKITLFNLIVIMQVITITPIIGKWKLLTLTINNVMEYNASDPIKTKTRMIEKANASDVATQKYFGDGGKMVDSSSISKLHTSFQDLTYTFYQDGRYTFTFMGNTISGRLISGSFCPKITM